jgi:hypothetical protein
MVLAICAAASNANDAVIGADIWTDHGSATLSRPPVLYFRLGDFRGTLEKTTLDNVRRVLGGVIVRNNGDAAAGEYDLCYSLASGERMTLSANAEMDGSEHSITGVVIESALPRTARPCTALPPRFDIFSMGMGLHLGMRSAALVHMLGPPSARVGGQMSFVYNKLVNSSDPALGAKSTSLAKQGFSVTDTLVVQTAGGRVTGLTGERVTSD